MATTTFCTKLDHLYIDRGLALYSSMRSFHPDAEMHVLALSEEAASFLEEKGLPGLRVIRLQTLIAGEPQLASVRSARTQAEFAFTLTPFLVCKALNQCRANEWAVYVDADMLFFGSVTSVLESARSFDVIMSRHNFSEHMKEQQRYGVYNTGFTAFRKTTSGEKCAQWWGDRCLEWCCDRLEEGKFADQKYIEQFPNVIERALSLDHIGVNCAPWTASGRRFSADKSRLLVDGVPLLLYHFAKVKRISARCLATRTRLQCVIGARGLHHHVYRPYARALLEATRAYCIPQKWVVDGAIERSGAKHRALTSDLSPSCFRLIAGLLRNEYVFSGFGQ